ncbi:MAG TPA: DJ-1/PfpI family protein [Solirubrobacterales bacterium]|jgi:protease I
MADELNGKRIAFLTANEGVEEVELTEPLKAVTEAGAKTELLAPEAGEVQAFNHLDKAESYTVDKPVGDASASDYDGLVLPGASPTRTPCAPTRRRCRSCATSSPKASRSG